MDHIAYLDRREAAEYLRGRGLKMSWTTLQKVATTGGGPRYRLLGRNAVYDPADLDVFIAKKLSPPRYSTSDVVA